MRAGRHLPAWVREVDDEARKAATMDALSADDVFRSQFRAEADAPRSPIEIIDWGIQHIDRLRKAGVEAREEKFKWLTGLTLPLLSMIIALTAILSNSCSERRRSNNEVESRKYETTFRIKHEAYISFMKALTDAFDHASRANIPAVVQTPALLQSIDRLKQPISHSNRFWTSKSKVRCGIDTRSLLQCAWSFRSLQPLQTKRNISNNFLLSGFTSGKNSTKLSFQNRRADLARALNAFRKSTGFTPSG